MTRGWPMALIVGGISLALTLALAPRPAPVPELLEIQALDAQLSKMERQARLLTESAGKVEAVYARDVEPIERALLRRARDPWLARQAAWAIVVEAETRDLSPALVAAVMMVENPWLDEDTVSYAGAVGLMQVMPTHLGSHDCGPDLTDGDVNVCYGTSILREYIGAALDEAVRDALNRYSGCRATPGCEKYAAKVVNLTEE